MRMSSTVIVSHIPKYMIDVFMKTAMYLPNAREI